MAALLQVKLHFSKLVWMPLGIGADVNGVLELDATQIELLHMKF